jgi:hypothetical protein
MDEANGGDLSATLVRVRRQVEQWRRGHRPRAPLPPSLWRQIAELARAWGINQTARALHMDYYSIKKHAEATGSDEEAPRFVEVLPGGLANGAMAVSTMPAAGPQCTIEVEEAGGSKMRIRLQGGELPDVLALARALREDRR